MKNHIRVDGRLLQTNKKWSHLKEKQKTWIMDTAKREYDCFVRERGKLPVHGSKQQFNEHIYELIEEKEIWIPYGEIKRVLDARIAHWNRIAEQASESEETVEKTDAQSTE